MTDNVDSRVPVTIDELRDYCNKSGISLYQLNFYLGSDHIGSNAHGIYKDYWTGDFIAYKNLEDGSKEVLYQGTDEAEGVKKLYDCLLNVLQNAEEQNASKRFGAEDKVYAEQEKLRSLIESVNSKEENQASYGDSIYSEAGSNSFGDESYDEPGSESVEDESYDETDSNSYEDGSYSEEENSDAFGDSSYGEEENVDEFGNSSYGDTNTEPFENTYRSNQDSDRYVESIYRTDRRTSLFGDSSLGQNNNRKSRSVVDNNKSEGSWMDIKTPLMKAAPNEDAEESGKEKDVFEDAYSIEDVKDLKTGVVYFFSKFTYYLSRLCYYISGIIFALSRVLIGVSHTLGKRVLELDKSYVNEKVTEENVEKINKAVATGFFDENGYDDKAQLLLDKTKYYTSRLFFYISKFSLRFSRYCYQTSDNVYDIEAEEKVSDRDNTVKAEDVIAGRERANRADVYKDANRKTVVNEYADSKAADYKEVASKTSVNDYAQNQTIATNNDYTKGIVRERSEDNTYYAEPQRNLDSLIKGIDPDVEILKPESSSYDLSEIAEEYNDDDDDSLDSLVSPLDEDDSDYSDYNDDYENEWTNEYIMKFFFGLIALIIFLIYLMASTNSSGFNEYGRSISSSFSHIWNW